MYMSVCTLIKLSPLILGWIRLNSTLYLLHAYTWVASMRQEEIYNHIDSFIYS